MVSLVFPKEKAVPLEVSIDWADLDFPNFQALEVERATRRSTADFFANLKAHTTLLQSSCFSSKSVISITM